MERSPESVLDPELAKTHLDAAEVERLESALAEYGQGRPKIDDFADVRTELDRTRDQAYLDMRKREFKRDPREIERNAEALEMVLMEFASSWMPGYASRTSEYDDMANHADLVLEMENDNDQILRVAIDATSSRQKTATKIRNIVADLRQGWLAKLKYFQSELDDSRDRKLLPQVVLGSDDPQSLTSLIRLYLNYRDADPTRRNVYRRAIQDHPFGQEAFAEVEFQLKRTASILRSADRPDEELDRKVAMVEAIITEFETFKEKKKALAQPTGAQGRNGVMAAIFRSLATT